MKKYLFIPFLCLSVITAFAQKSSVKFDNTTVNFGEVKNWKNQAAVFTFTNKGDRDIMFLPRFPKPDILVELPKGAIPPGGRGEVRVYFFTSALGDFKKKVSIYDNDTKSPIVLTLKGNILSLDATAYIECPGFAPKGGKQITVFEQEVLVIDAETRDPVEEAYVTLSNLNVNQKEQTKKDGTSRFDLEPGMLSVFVEKYGYEPTSRSVFINKQTGTIMMELEPFKLKDVGDLALHVPETSTTSNSRPPVQKEKVEKKTTYQPRKVTKEEDDRSWAVDIPREPVKKTEPVNNKAHEEYHQSDEERQAELESIEERMERARAKLDEEEAADDDPDGPYYWEVETPAETSHRGKEEEENTSAHEAYYKEQAEKKTVEARKKNEPEITDDIRIVAADDKHADSKNEASDEPDEPYYWEVEIPDYEETKEESKEETTSAHDRYYKTHKEDPSRETEPVVTAIETKSNKPVIAEPLDVDEPVTLPVSKFNANNIVFLIDVSTSMDKPEKLPLLKMSIKQLTSVLRDIDLITVITYSSEAQVAVATTPADRRDWIAGELDRLEAGGWTHGVKGVQTAYAAISANFFEKGNNQIILATDGKFNNPDYSENELYSLVKEEAKHGVKLSVIGFGDDNEALRSMKKLASKGDGSFLQIENEMQARRALVEEIKLHSSIQQ